MRGFREFVARNQDVIERCGDSRVTVALVVGRAVAAWIVRAVAATDTAGVVAAARVVVGVAWIVRGLAVGGVMATDVEDCGVVVGVATDVAAVGAVVVERERSRVGKEWMRLARLRRGGAGSTSCSVKAG